MVLFLSHHDIFLVSEVVILIRFGSSPAEVRELGRWICLEW